MIKPLLDMLGKGLKVGDLVAYGKSNRHHPISVGTIEDIDEKYILVKGLLNSKPGKISRHNADDRLVLING